MIRNPGTWNLDMGIRKAVRIRCEQRAQVRVEAFNVLNHPNWSGANSNPNSGSFGLLTGKTGEWMIQLAVKYSF